jgi:hypothetical protein
LRRQDPPATAGGSDLSLYCNLVLVLARALVREANPVKLKPYA